MPSHEAPDAGGALPPAGAGDCAAHCPIAAGGIDRRTFLSQSVLAGIAVALAACTTGDSVTAPTSVSGSVRVADYPALANTGGIAVLRLSGSPVAIVRTGSASFAALSLVCPHQGATVSVSGSGFVCPRHGARFASSGAWTGGQRTSSLHAYATSYDSASGTIAIG